MQGKVPDKRGCALGGVRGIKEEWQKSEWLVISQTCIWQDSKRPSKDYLLKAESEW